MKIKTLFAALLLAGCTLTAGAQEYQWSAPLKGLVSAETDDAPEAFLWIPADCREVKAVMFSQQNMTEEPIFNSERFRKTLARLGFAIVWVAPGISQQWNTADGCQKAFDTVMRDLAEKSGYTELATAPVVPVGHSAMATFPWNFAAWNPDRTLAVISYHGDAPRTNLCGYGRENLEWGRTRNIDGIPGLMIEGEYEWWEARVNPALAFRMMYPESCISFLCDAGHGHFDYTDAVIDYISLFLDKAAAYRLPQQADGKLRKLNPADGWLAARWNASQKASDRPAPAPVARYKGDPHDAFWYFDAEMAAATEDYYATSLGKRPQYIGYRLAGGMTGYNSKLHAGTIIDAPLGRDGLTFHLSAAFTDSLRTAPSTAHAAGKIDIEPITGPVEKVNDTTFTVRFYRTGFKNKRRTNDIWFQAINPGDKTYKAAVQQIEVKIPMRITDGRPQTISFARPADVTTKVKTIRLKASASSKLPVYFYVKEGPAGVKGNRLVLSQLPPRTKYPVKVTVVAWQYGVKGRFQTAAPVEQSFLIKE